MGLPSRSALDQTRGGEPLAVGGGSTLVGARRDAVTLGCRDLGCAGEAIDARLTQRDPLAHESGRKVELARPDRCVEQRALQRVALRVRSTEVLEHVSNRQEVLDHRGVVAAGGCDDRATRRQPDLGGHGQVGDLGASARGDIAIEPFDHEVRVVDASGADERHHRVKVVERVPGHVS